jgi:hypothetical protein
VKPWTIALAAALLAPSVASAQTAKENFSYSAPSGMFGDGTTKWQLFRFIEEDQERLAALRAGQEPTATGSIQGSANSDSVRRPGEFNRRRSQ